MHTLARNRRAPVSRHSCSARYLGGMTTARKLLLSVAVVFVAGVIVSIGLELAYGHPRPDLRQPVVLLLVAAPLFLIWKR